MLYISLCALVQDMGKSVLVGNINIWVQRMENIMQWQQQLDNIQINRVSTLTKNSPYNIIKVGAERQRNEMFLILFLIYLLVYFLGISTANFILMCFNLLSSVFEDSKAKTKCIIFLPAFSYWHGADRLAGQPAAQHHAAPDGRQGSGQPGPSFSRAGAPHRGPAAVEKALPVPLHRQTGMKKQFVLSCLFFKKRPLASRRPGRCCCCCPAVNSCSG